MNNAGISTESMNAQIAHSAKKTLDEHIALNAEAMALAATFDKTLDAVIALAPRLAAALRARRESYHRAVVAERQRARAVGEESRESEIAVKRYARDFRSPLAQLEPLSEYSITVPSDTFDDSVLESRSAAFNYQPTGEPVPMRRGKG